MKTLRLLPFLATMMLLNSCSKDLTDSVQKLPASLSELKAASTFSWTTGKTIEVTITGLPVSNPVYSTLSLSLHDGSSLYQSMHNIDNDVTIQVVVPSVEKSIKIRFGSNEYELPIEGEKASFSFIPVLAD